MKQEARRRGVDLLLVDSGDRVDGNGLVDAEPAPNVKGYARAEFRQVHVHTGLCSLNGMPTAGQPCRISHKCLMM